MGILSGYVPKSEAPLRGADQVAGDGRVAAETWGAITDHLAPDAQVLTLDSAGTFSLAVFLHLSKPTASAV